MGVEPMPTALPLWPSLPLCTATGLTPPDGNDLMPVSFPLLGEPCSFTLTTTHAPLPEDACTVTLEAGDVQGRLDIDAAWLDALCRRVGLTRPPQTAWPEVDAALRSALLACLLLPLLARLKSLFGHSVQPSPHDPRTHVTDLRCIALSPVDQEDEATAVMWLSLPDAALQQLPRAPTHEAMWQRVPITVSLLAGRQRLRPAQLASLRPGDVVLLDRPPHGLQLAVAPSLLADVREQDGGYVVAGAWHIDEHREISMETITTETDSTTPVALDQLTLPLVCEVGRLVLSMSDLKALRAGSVLPMNRPADQAVDLIVNGQKVGQGELVRLDGTLGVRIVRLADVHG